jgi:S-adenosylmethionine uptake transporter
MTAATSRASALAQCTAGVGALCLMDAIVKHLTVDHAVLTVSFGRYVTGAALALAVWAA